MSMVAQADDERPVGWLPALPGVVRSGAWPVSGGGAGEGGALSCALAWRDGVPGSYDGRQDALKR